MQSYQRLLHRGWTADRACAAADYDLRCDNVFEHTPRRDQNSMDELSVLVSGHPDNRVYDRQFKACTPPMTPVV